jgi:hypothetical protein
MQVELKQGVFRFLLLSNINELMVNKELIVNTIRKATINVNVARSVDEIENGAVANTKPILTKELDQILRDLTAFALSGGDNKRNAASESTATSEIQVVNDTVDIKNQTFMLESAWGFLGEDAEGNSLSDELEIAFQSYIKITREIASWVMYLTVSKNEEIVQIGASTLSTLLSKWGPVSLEDDLDDKYNRLFEHVYYYALNGEVLQLLESLPIGIAIKTGEKTEVKFDSTGHVCIKLPMPIEGGENTDERYYLTNVDYIDPIDDCGKPDIDVEVDYEDCSDLFCLALKSINGVKICEREPRIPQSIGTIKFYDTPPSVGVYEPLPTIPEGAIEQCCAPPVLLLPLIGCTPQDTANDAVMVGMQQGMTDYQVNNMRLTNDPVCAGIVTSDCQIIYHASNHAITTEEVCNDEAIQEVKDNPSQMFGDLNCGFR